MALIVMPFTTWFTVWETRWFLNPDLRPYVDPWVLTVVLVLTSTLLVGEVATVAACLVVRRRSPESEVPGILFSLLFFVISAFTSYFLGHYTTPQGGISALGGAIFFALLVGRRAALIGVGSFFLIALVTTVAEQWGWLPYGPLFRDSPAASGHLSGDYVAFLGAPLFSGVLAIALLADYLFIRWREREEELRVSREQLERAYEQLQGSQAQLVQSEKMASLGRLVAGAAHELNNPASFVAGGIENLKEYLQPILRLLRAYEAVPIEDPEMARALEELRSGARLDYVLRETPELLRICGEGTLRIRKIVEELSLFSRTTAGRVSTRIDESVEASLSLQRDRIERGGVRIHRVYGEVPTLQVDSDQLGHVWSNLLCNALDAVENETDPEVVLSIGRRTDEEGMEWVEVEVRDNGAGIDEESRGHVFEPFFTTKPIGQGTGLGLSIAYGVLRAHDGDLRVESAAGGPTSFIARLPVDPPG